MPTSTKNGIHDFLSDLSAVVRELIAIMSRLFWRKMIDMDGNKMIDMAKGKNKVIDSISRPVALRSSVKPNV